MADSLSNGLWSYTWCCSWCVPSSRRDWCSWACAESSIPGSEKDAAACTRSIAIGPQRMQSRCLPSATRPFCLWRNAANTKYITSHTSSNSAATTYTKTSTLGPQDKQRSTLKSNPSHKAKQRPTLPPFLSTCYTALESKWTAELQNIVEDIIAHECR